MKSCRRTTLIAGLLSLVAVITTSTFTVTPVILTETLLFLPRKSPDTGSAMVMFAAEAKEAMIVRANNAVLFANRFTALIYQFC